MRIAVIGASGLLGQHLVSEAISRGHQVMGTYYSNRISDPRFAAVKLDIRDADAVKASLEEFCPEWVLLASALTDVDECQRYPSRAYELNVEGTFNVVSTCKGLGAKLLYVSTDYVFNGTKGGFYAERDIVDPQSIYAQTKYEGESVTLDASSDNLVCRVSVLFGWNTITGEHNFVTWLIDTLRRGKQVKLFGDQRVSPTYAPDCSSVLLDLMSGGAKGVFHTSGRDCVSRFGMGKQVAEVFGLEEDLVTESSIDQANWLAPRPRRSCLDVRKAEALLNRPLPTFRASLEKMKESEVGI